jgi:hypothetical protein
MASPVKFRDPQISFSKFRDLDDTASQVQGPAVNFALAEKLCKGSSRKAM